MAISFTPAEVDFLFPAPFHRRELLIYKLAKLFMGAVFMALFFSMSVLIYLNTWLAAFVGIFLTLAFTQLLALTVALVGPDRGRTCLYAHPQADPARRGSARRGRAGPGALADSDSKYSRAGLELPDNHGPAGSCWRRSKSSAMRSWPAPFFPTWSAGGRRRPRSTWACWSWSSSSTPTISKGRPRSARSSTNECSARTGRRHCAADIENAARLRIPRLPWLGGAGPLAWRQLLLAMRTSRLIILISLGTRGACCWCWPCSCPADTQGSESVIIPAMGLGFIAYLTFLFAMQLPWAFRGDIDHMDSLKTLPVAPLALAAGELAGGVLVLAAIQFVVLAALLAAKGNPAVIVTAAAFLVPFDVLMLGVSNLLFLIYPVRMVQTNAADFQLMGRMMLLMLLQFLILIPGLGIPAAIGGIVFWLSGFSWPAFAATSWLLLLAELPLVLIVLAWVFERFDPSTEMPA